MPLPTNPGGVAHNVGPSYSPRTLSPQRRYPEDTTAPIRIILVNPTDDLPPVPMSPRKRETGPHLKRHPSPLMKWLQPHIIGSRTLSENLLCPLPGQRIRLVGHFPTHVIRMFDLSVLSGKIRNDLGCGVL